MNNGGGASGKPLRIAALALALASLWLLLREVDIPVSKLFYRAGSGFFLADRTPLQVIYHGTRWCVSAIIVGLLGSLVYSLLPITKWGLAWRGRLAFLTLSLAIGPGLITHTLFKDHWGRPRPEQIIEFGGAGHYVAPLLPSAQCDHNCSFPSGHAAAGFWLISAAWVWPRHRRRWLMAGVGTGFVVGLTRIAQGGHFLSDVLAAMAVVWMVNALLSRWMQKRGWLVPVSLQNEH